MGGRASGSITYPQCLVPAPHTLPESPTELLAFGSCRFYRTVTVTTFSPSEQGFSE